MSIELTTQEAQTLKSVLSAVSKTFLRYPGMNTGSSQVHNLYWSDIETLLGIHDKLPVEL